MKAELNKKNKIWTIRENERVELTLPIEDVTTSVIKSFIQDIEKDKTRTKDEKRYSYEENDVPQFSENNNDEQILWFEGQFDSQNFGIYLLQNLEQTREELAKENDIIVDGSNGQLKTSTIFGYEQEQRAVWK